MNAVLNMKRRIGLGLLWLPGVGLPLVCIELFGGKDLSDEDRALYWTILLSHIAATALAWVFFIGFLVWVLCLVYAILTFCGKNVPEMPFLCKLGEKLAKWTKPCEPAEAPAPEPAPEPEPESAPEPEPAPEPEAL